MHPALSHPVRRTVTRLLPLALLATLALPPVARSAPTLGFVESWPGTSTDGWSGSFSITYSNPGSGGQMGGADGYLLLTQPPPAGHFGTRSVGSEYVGDWQAAGITKIKFWLNDVNTDEAFEIHLAIGQFDNLWEYNQGFIPPLNSWAEFTVDLTDSLNYTHIIPTNGFGFNFALQNVAVLHIRHDLAPYMQLPDDIAGDLGVDELQLTNAVGAVGGPPSALQPVELAAPYPNPSRGAVAMSIQNRDGGEVRLQVVDIQGRVLRSAMLAVAAQAPGLWVWDGLDDRGHKVPPGAYRVRAIGSSGGTSRPLVRVE